MSKEYKNVCHDCGEKLYGKPKRDLGAITISLDECEECKEVKAIVPAIDWRNMHKDTVNSLDWD